jgi:hypothetical protein
MEKITINQVEIAGIITEPDFTEVLFPKTKNQAGPYSTRNSWELLGRRGWHSGWQWGPETRKPYRYPP